LPSPTLKPNFLKPLTWIKNLGGGGEMPRDRLAIADLEIKAATLEAARAELERQREEEKVNLGDKVLRLVLDYEAATRRVKLVESQLQSFNVSRDGWGRGRLSSCWEWRRGEAEIRAKSDTHIKKP
jgi:hypothetical protein